MTIGIKKERKLYEKAIKKWDNLQVDLLMEENNELINAISTLLHPIIKERRRNDGFLPSKNLKKLLDNYPIEQQQLLDEFADAIIVWSQFIPDFWSELKKNKERKLQRLESRLEK